MQRATQPPLRRASWLHIEVAADDGKFVRIRNLPCQFEKLLGLQVAQPVHVNDAERTIEGSV
jgi:hypothetical protein